MDINGAKALKKRLGQNGADEAPPTELSADVSEGAPPVYQWLGVSQPKAKASSTGDDQPAVRAASLFRRLSLSLR